MSKPELSDIENNLALVIALEKSKAEVMEDLARCFQQMTVFNTAFQNSADVWKESADTTREAIITMMEGICDFDSDGKIKAFLEGHKLNAIWGEK